MHSEIEDTKVYLRKVKPTILSLDQDQVGCGYQWEGDILILDRFTPFAKILIDKNISKRMSDQEVKEWREQQAKELEEYKNAYIKAHTFPCPHCGKDIYRPSGAVS